MLCPLKLRDNWTVYKANSRLNRFLADRFRYDVLAHTDLSRERGYSGDINLETLNWGNYDLIVIDESHNFRNNTPGKRDEAGSLIRKSRYQRLLDEIIKAGVRTKVLLLSATPVNNNLKDLRDQLYFLTEGSDMAFAETLGIGSLKETLAAAQKVFSLWARQHSSERKTSELLERLNAAQDVSPETDAKRQELKQLIAAKVAEPTTNKLGEPNKKVLVFTAFADTASYLYDSLVQWANKDRKRSPPRPRYAARQMSCSIAAGIGSKDGVGSPDNADAQAAVR